MGEVILTMKDIDKSFPGVHALDHVNFEVKRGEVHALMGENGAGKSTLMKVLTGIYQKDSGSITYKGKETEFHNTREAQDAGVVIVHQELNMVGDLTVAQNIFIGREPKKGFSIDDKKMIEDSKKLFQELNIEINPKEKMNNLTVGKQQMCDIDRTATDWNIEWIVNGHAILINAVGDEDLDIRLVRSPLIAEGLHIGDGLVLLLQVVHILRIIFL